MERFCKMNNAPKDNKELINRILISMQFFRKNAMTDGKYYMENATEPMTDEQAEVILTDLFPYVFGPKSILPVIDRKSVV